MKPLQYSVKLWPEQEEAVDFVLQREASALFFEQRTGKTYITMSILERLPRADLACVLVCILNNKESTWGDKLAEFLPWLNVARTWDEFKAMPCPKVLLVHMEGLSKIATLIQRVMKTKKPWITFGVIDEAHRLKARGTGQSRAAAKIKRIPKRLILTGTPIEKQPKDLWAQFRFVDDEVFGSWKEFENEFLDIKLIDVRKFRYGGMQWQKAMLQNRIMRSKAKFREDRMPELIRRLKPYALRLTKRDVGIIEPEVIKVSVPMFGAQRRYYDAMRDTSVVRLDDGSRVLAPLTVTNIIKRRQIASGFVYDDDEVCHEFGGAKLRKLMAMVRRLSKPIVVFTSFQPETEFIARRLRAEKYRVAVVQGKTKKKLRPEIWRKHQRAQYDVTVCQIRTGGVGVDLWKSSNAIAHSIGYSSIDFDQAKSRMDHKDKKKASRVFVLCADATVDDDLYDMVVEKGLDAAKVLNQLKRRSK